MIDIAKSISFQRIQRPELFVGLVGPLGVNIPDVISELEKSFATVGYNPKVIKLSDIFPKIKGLNAALTPAPLDKRIDSYMNFGTEYREKMQRGDAIALAAIFQIREARERFWKAEEKEAGREYEEKHKRPIPSTVYILDSIKHEKEVETLRNVYGRAFYLVSIYAPREKRKEALAEKIAESHGERNISHYYPHAEELINKDLDEENKKLGQSVEAAFPLADYFIQGNTKLKNKNNIQRFVELVFNHPFHTPYKDEFGIFQAKAASLCSADLSRQVGAAIVDKEGAIIALGHNEVPKAGGGSYCAEDEHDFRDFQLGIDHNAKVKKDMWTEILSKLEKVGALSAEAMAKKPSKLADEVLAEETFKEARVSNILEFGRIVHAEMSAITDAARKGLAVKGATLYCTTFPCHICARHIIASGIKRVVYIEPYPKSMTADLYKDSVAVDKSDKVAGKVVFESFIGISPVRYIEFFTMSQKRKNKDGKATDWNHKEAIPRLERFVTSYAYIEDMALKDWDDITTEKGITI